MIEFTKDQKLQAYRRLSPAEQEAAFSESIADSIFAIANKHGLDHAESKRFQHGIGLYILKLISAGELQTVIVERLGIKYRAPIIYEEVLESVFPEIERVIEEYEPDSEDESESDSE